MDQLNPQLKGLVVLPPSFDHSFMSSQSDHTLRHTPSSCQDFISEPWMNKTMDKYRESNYHICYSEDLAILGVSNLISVWRHYETKTNEGSRIACITEKVAHQHVQNATFGLFTTARLSVAKIDSSPPFHFYQKFEWASKSLCLLAQKVC